LSSEQSSNECWLDQLKVHLKQQRYSSQSTRRRIAAAQRFVDYLDQQHIVVETVDLFNVNLYLHNELQLFQQNRRRAPRSSMTDWRRTHTAGIDMLLRLVHGQWPPAPAPSTPSEVFHRDLCGQYDEWMRDLRGLASETRSNCCAEAHRFLAWMDDDGSTQQSLLGVTIVNVDAYMTFRAKSQRRSSLRSLAANLRSFLRYLNATGRTKDDLSTTVIGPTLYAFESIPSVVRPEDIKMVVEKTRQDHSKRGRRDYAILMLLSSYGLRAGEITSLRLDDVDWQGDVLRIHHSKTGAHSELPLLPAVGNAILDYLQKGRPKTEARAIFIVDHAPYRPFQCGSCLYWVVRNRLTAAGVNVQGKQGPHAFRHARAVSLLRAAVPAKEIGDILGHRSASSTTAYLKLATEDLRAVALEIPGEVKA
jgi:site-specific recombinase XerD